MQTIDTSNLTHKEWLDLRKQRIGGSDAAAALNKNPYKSPYVLWLEKTKRHEFDHSSNLTWLGNQLEPLIREEFCKRTGFKVSTPEKTFIHEKYGCLAANVDGIIQPSDKHEGHGILEIKCTTRSRIPVLAEFEDLPIEYQTQLIHYSGVLKLSYIYFFCFFRDTAEFSKPLLIRPDWQQVQDTNRRVAKWYHRYVEKDRPPPMSRSQDLQIAYPRSQDETTIEASPDVQSSYHALKVVRERISQLDDLKESYELDIKKHMKNNEVLTDREGNKLCSWKTQQRNRLDTKQLKKERPDIYKQFRTQNETRVFRVS